jgi:hypothetical protein
MQRSVTLRSSRVLTLGLGGEEPLLLAALQRVAGEPEREPDHHDERARRRRRTRDRIAGGTG